MKQLPFKIAAGVLSFVFFLFFFGGMMNRGNTDMTVEMASATYPVISFLSGNETYNPTFGYSVRPEVSLHKENITPLGENRSLAFQIQTYTQDSVDGIFLEVRTGDGSRLIEDTEIKEYTYEGDVINVYTSLKDLIKEGEEYSLTIRLLVDRQELFYHTRVIWDEAVDVLTYLEFTRDFTSRTFGEKTEYEELKKYLESSSKGDNSDFGHVDIHSSLEQVAWGNLEAKQEGNIEAVLLTAEKNIATLKQVYLVQIGQGENAEHYRAEEYFRLKKGTDRLHLIEYERTVSRLIFEEDDLFFGNTLYLGISDGNLQYTESAEGGKVAFVKDGVLYVADPGSNHFARVYSYYDKSDYSERPLTELPRLKIFNIDEEGRTTFAVYGYIPRGLHEGQSGLLVYTFDFAKNTLEEELFVPYGGSTEVLAANLDTLLYLNGAGKLYFYLDGCIYEANARSAEYEVIAKELTPDSFCVNGTGTMAAWTQSQAATGVKKITLENFETMRQTTIEAKSGEVILPKAFMKNDFVYGSARAEDVSVDAYGNVLFPMYSVKIQTEDGTVYKNYEMDGIYVTECTVSDNLLTLTRVKKDENGNFRETDSDSIVDNTPDEAKKNTLETVATENYETVYQFALKEDYTGKKLQIMRPKFTLYEEDREPDLGAGDQNRFFYAYARGRVTGIYANPSDAVRSACADGGFVLDQDSDYVWQKKELQAKNQIMAIKEAGIPEGGSSLAVAMESMMQYEGFSQDADAGLQSGMVPEEILGKYMADREIVNLTGCPIDVVYYYLNRDIPVLAITENGGGILLTGFNASEIVWMDPARGELHKVSKEESKKAFERGNNNFITYIRKAD